MGLVDKWKAMWKDRHLCNLEELEKRLKTNKIVTTLQLIPIVILTTIMLCYFFMEENIIIGVVMILIIFFIVQFQLVFYMLSIIDDNNLKTLVYLKTINNPNDKELNKK